MITSIVVSLFLVALGVGGNAAWAGNGGCGCGHSCQGGGPSARTKFVPNVTYYAPYPYWWPNYFGPPHTDYQVSQYVHPPEESALLVKERIFAANAANPALLPLPKEPLPYPTKSDKNNVPDKLP